VAILIREHDIKLALELFAVDGNNVKEHVSVVESPLEENISCALYFRRITGPRGAIDHYIWGALDENGNPPPKPVDVIDHSIMIRGETLANFDKTQRERRGY
jgi:hypothetical protein